MKRTVHQLVAVGVTALLLVGCSRDNGSQPSATGSQADAGGALSSPEPDSASQQNAAAPEDVDQATAKVADTADAEPAPAVPEPGEPGSIKGVVKSPYTRLAEAALFIVRVDGLDFNPPEKHAVMDQKNLIFIPHVLPVLVGTTVDFPNSDTVRHNVFSKDPAHVFNLGQYDVGVVKQETLAQVGVVQLRCNVHAEMNAYIVVCQNPYFAVTDKKRGSFVIPDVPPGKWQLRLFHERLEETTIDVVVEPGKETVVEFTDLKRA